MKITINPYDKKSINEAIKQVKAYKNRVAKKEAEMLEKLARFGRDVAQVRFSQALYAGTNDVQCRFDSSGSTATIYAEGQAVGFIEFGTGVRHAEYPQDKDYIPPKHGTYGKGKGANPGWWDYYGDPGNKGHVISEKNGRIKVRTSGNEPAMAMYEAVNRMAEQIVEIAREVWSSD